MKYSKPIPIEQVLLQEMQDREALDPHYYDDLKQSTIGRMLALGIAPEIVTTLYSVKLSELLAPPPKI